MLEIIWKSEKKTSDLFKNIIDRMFTNDIFNIYV